ncbi:MAG: mycothiol conjugate amidase Mca [Actinomycetota bacterium]
MTPLSLLTVHAHPDDESSKGAGTVRRYRDQGVRTTLVCCTHGEEGDILNPELDVEEVKANLTDVRLRELDDAAEIIGYDRVHLLGYRDSGMAESESNEHPDCFHQAPVEEAVGRLVEVIRQERPQVIVTYSDDQAGYPHPDHLKVHDITIPAFEAAGDPDAYPDHGEPWQPLKLYYSVWARARMVQTHEKFLELGLESPFDEKWFERPSQDHRITTQVPVDNDIRRRALLCHRTQVDPSSPFWFGLPPEVQREIHPFDDYVLARSLVDAPTPEDDLFAGVRQAVSS